MAVTNNSSNHRITQFNVAVGAANNLITSIAPSSTSGVPFISQGSSSNPTFGTAVVAGGGTGLTSSTPYAIFAGGTTSTGNLQQLGTGTTGQVLTSQGSSALPTWGSAGGVGEWILIQSITASNQANVQFTSGITNAYPMYVLTMNSIIPVTNSALTMVVSTNGGSSYLSTGYSYGTNSWTYASATASNTSGSNLMFSSSGNGIGSASRGFNGIMWLSGLGTSTPPSIWGSGNETSSSPTNVFDMFTGINSTTAGVNALQFAFGTGNISSGTFSLYGIKNS